MNILLNPTRYCINDTSIYKLTKEELAQCHAAEPVGHAKAELDMLRREMEAKYGTKYRASWNDEEEMNHAKALLALRTSQAVHRRLATAEKIKRIQKSLPEQIVLDPTTVEPVLKLNQQLSDQSEQSTSDDGTAFMDLLTIASEVRQHPNADVAMKPQQGKVAVPADATYKRQLQLLVSRRQTVFSGKPLCDICQADETLPEKSRSMQYSAVMNLAWQLYAAYSSRTWGGRLSGMHTKQAQWNRLNPPKATPQIYQCPVCPTIRKHVYDMRHHINHTHANEHENDLTEAEVMTLIVTYFLERGYQMTTHQIKRLQEYHQEKNAKSKLSRERKRKRED